MMPITWAPLSVLLACGSMSRPVKPRPDMECEEGQAWVRLSMYEMAVRTRASSVEGYILTAGLMDHGHMGQRGNAMLPG